jgi:hypothetical protein
MEVIREKSNEKHEGTRLFYLPEAVEMVEYTILHEMWSYHL